VREHAPLLALLELRVDPHLEETERSLGASKLEFQEAIIKQMQSLTDQMSLMISSQQPDPPSPIESGMHASRLWCVQTKLDTLGNFVEQGRTVTKETMVAHLNKTQEAKGKISMVKAIIRDPLLKDKLVRMWKERRFIFFVEMTCIEPVSVRSLELWL
jgi:hypothetical protein